MRDTHAIATPQPIWLGELNKTVDLAATDFGNDVVRNMRRPDPVHDQTQRSRRPAGSVPLQLNQNQAVAGKHRRPKLDLSSGADPPIPEPRVVRLVAGYSQIIER